MHTHNFYQIMYVSLYVSMCMCIRMILSGYVCISACICVNLSPPFLVSPPALWAFNCTVSSFGSTSSNQQHNVWFPFYHGFRDPFFSSPEGLTRSKQWRRVSTTTACWRPRMTSILMSENTNYSGTVAVKVPSSQKSGFSQSCCVRNIAHSSTLTGVLESTAHVNDIFSCF